MKLLLRYFLLLLPSKNRISANSFVHVADSKPICHPAVIAAIASAMFNVGCAAKSVPLHGPISEGIHIHIHASADLNSFKNRPHTVILNLFQMTGAEKFRQAIGNNSNIGDMISAKAFKDDVLSTYSHVIQPGESGKLVLDIVENAKVLAVVAGYFNILETNKIYRLYSLRLLTEPTEFWQPKNSPHILIDLMLSDDGLGGVRL